MDSTKTSKLATVRQLSQRPEYSAVFTETRLRTLLATAEPRLGARGNTIPGNGLKEAGAIVRIGRRIYFDIRCFQDWLGSRKVS